MSKRDYTEGVLAAVKSLEEIARAAIASFASFQAAFRSLARMTPQLESVLIDAMEDLYRKQHFKRPMGSKRTARLRKKRAKFLSEWYLASREWERWLDKGEEFEIQWRDESTGRETRPWFRDSCWREHNGNDMPERVRPWIRRKIRGRWEPYVYAPW